MKAAYADGCDYLYQSNDDVSFVSSGWASHFVDALRASPLRANYGVVGGLDLNNHLVLTQSLVHRTHQTMFGSHLPPAINDWHLDDCSESRPCMGLYRAPRDQPLEARAHAQHKQVWDAVF